MVARRLCGAPARAASRSAVTSDFASPETTDSRSSVVARFWSRSLDSSAWMYVRRIAPDNSLAEIPCSKARRVSGRTNDANMFRTASFSRADLFIVETLLFLHNSNYFSDLCQLTMCDSASIERPYNGENRAETKAYDPAGNGEEGYQEGLSGPAALNRCGRATLRRRAPTCARRAPGGGDARGSRSDPSCRRCNQRRRGPVRTCRAQLRRVPRGRGVPSA